MGRAPKLVTALAASVSLVASTTAMAGAPVLRPQASPAKMAKAQQPNSWLLLSALTPGAPQETVRPQAMAALGAAQVTATLPSRPAGYVAGNSLIGAEVFAFGLWFALIAVALTISDSSGGRDVSGGTPNSPT